MNYEFKENNGPFRLKDLKNGMFQIHSKKFGAYEGTLRPILDTAMRWGINCNELKYALEDLIKGYDYSEFGIFGGYLYSKNKNDKE